MSEIKPCQFCGSDEINIRAKSFTDGSFQTWIECALCHAQTKRTNDLDAAIEAWNTRAERTCVMHRRGSSTDNRECSECGASYRGDVLYPLNYCPNCGAKIIGGNE